MKHVIIGTAGHVDHGKTVLVKALTGTDTDRLAEEKRLDVLAALLSGIRKPLSCSAVRPRSLCIYRRLPLIGIAGTTWTGTILCG